MYTMHKVETGFTGSMLLYKCTRYKQINQDSKWKVGIWKMKGQFQLDNTPTHTQRDICTSRAASSQLKSAILPYTSLFNRNSTWY